MTKRELLLGLTAAFCLTIGAQNPILRGFNPDPTICRSGEDYYICTSSFTWFPALPIYHSKDLIHWELAGHAINNPEYLELDGIKDKDGVWAPTIREHKGKWYIFSNVSYGGNFFITADDVNGPWSEPKFIKEAPGIDPSIFWDDDDTPYMLANVWGLDKEKYGSNIAIWMQQIDLENGKLLGERHILTTGHASNAKSPEGARLYKINGSYVLLIAEGGTDENHAVTMFTSKELFGPYNPLQVNPVLTHRHLGFDFPIQSVGHGDLVETQNGEWYSVALGKRMIDGKYAFTRETFLCPVSLEHGQFIFNKGKGMLTLDIPTPNLPPFEAKQFADTDFFDGEKLPDCWYTERIAHSNFYDLNGENLELSLKPETIDSLVCPALLMRKVPSNSYLTETSFSFTTKKEGEKAGIVLFRNNTSYVAVMKTKEGIEIIENGEVTSTKEYDDKDLCIRIEADGIEASISCGKTHDSLEKIGKVSLKPLTEFGKINRFNGVGAGIYATSSSQKSKEKATFSYFTLKDKASYKD